ncbi:glyoxalase [Sphingomonas sp. Leaf412]|uniref:VOC family protein n=1 Tax=Sphingomonas sp. Leaf412 TaxID=1736370 RepID=UPI0006F6C1B3|nr:VOC family protein [Sphingomonas sp. Leaf412]KQT34827.1 glyoxalase [Sphingomonas sp. Leaf412]
MADPDGMPIWFELNTADVDAARSFYAAVAGWDIAAPPMAEHHDYFVAQAADGGGVAGIVSPPLCVPGFPGWLVYFATADVDATAARVTGSGGGIVLGPMDIPHVGRFALAHDPQGVTFAVMARTDPTPSQAFGQRAGNVGHGVWIELSTPDPDGAFAFYGALFGWERAGAMPMGELGDYAFIGKGADFRPGAIMSSTATGAPARWNWYVLVPDIDAAIATATAGGGALMQGPDQIPGGDYSANITDVAGHQIGIVGPRKEA